MQYIPELVILFLCPYGKISFTVINVSELLKIFPTSRRQEIKAIFRNSNQRVGHMRLKVLSIQSLTEIYGNYESSFVT